jgi:hypothetical protein
VTPTITSDSTSASAAVLSIDYWATQWTGGTRT